MTEPPQLAAAPAAAPKRVLIVLLGAIGDVVRALPLVQRMRAGWPQCEIAWAVEPAAAPVLDAHPAIDRVIVFDRSNGVRAFPAFLRAVLAWRPDVTLDLQRHLKSGFTSWCSRAPRRVGFNWRNSREANCLFNNESIPPVEQLSAKLDHYRAFGDVLALPDTSVSFGLTLRGSEQQRVSELLRDVSGPFAVFFVGASWPTKLWHPGPAAAVVDRLAERGISVVLIGAPGDCEAARHVVSETRQAPVDLCGRTSLRDVIGIFQRAEVAFGPDSGPMHLAAAVGVPVVSLFGATSPARSGPYGFDHLVVEGDAPCRPCYSRRCSIGRKCMDAITADRVMAKLEFALREPAPAFDAISDNSAESGG